MVSASVRAGRAGAVHHDVVHDGQNMRSHEAPYNTRKMARVDHPGCSRTLFLAVSRATPVNRAGAQKAVGGSLIS